MTYKVAVSLDGRVAVPGVALGQRRGLAEARAPAARRLRRRRGRDGNRALGQPAARRARRSPSRGQPRRLAFGRGPLPEGSELELRSGPLREELEALAAEGVQSLLLEGGPTLAAAFLEQDLVDKMLVFVAPKLSGEGSGMLAGLPRDALTSSASRRARSARTCSSRATSTSR